LAGIPGWLLDRDERTKRDAFELAIKMDLGGIIKKQKKAQTEDERTPMLESSTVQSPRKFAKEKENVKVSVVATIA